MTVDNDLLADSVDEVMLDDYEVGSPVAFVLCVMVVIVFQVYGFVVTFVLSQSHASRLGSIGGLGLFLAFSSLALETDIEKEVGEAWRPYIPLGSLAVAIIGYMIFIYAVTSFQNIRKVAETMVHFPASRPRFHPGNVEAV